MGWKYDRGVIHARWRQITHCRIFRSLVEVHNPRAGSKSEISEIIRDEALIRGLSRYPLARVRHFMPHPGVVTSYYNAPVNGAPTLLLPVSHLVSSPILGKCILILIPRDSSYVTRVVGLFVSVNNLSRIWRGALSTIQCRGTVVSRSTRRY